MDTSIDYYYGDSLRWAFGFDNPNKAAVIYACLFPLAWLLWSLAWRIKLPWGKWPCLLVTGALVLLDAFCLFKTYSRGGVAAALAGLLYLLWKNARLDAGWLKSIHSGKFYGGSVLGILLLSLFIWVGLGDRSMEPITQGDASVSHRLVLWRTALEMAVDNPTGFGTGHSGDVYMQWYEPLEMSASYRTMVNSYLTFLVEQGWLPSALLLIGFLLFWVWTTPPKSQLPSFETSSGLRASLIAFLIAGLFSTVMEEPLLWIIPGACAAALMIGGILMRRNLSLNKLLGTSIGGIAMLACLFMGGLVQKHFDSLTHRCGSIDGSPNIVEIEKNGETAAQTWTVILDQKILGDNYGKLLRQLVFQAGIRLKIQGKTSSIPADTRLLLVGDAVQATPIASALPIILLSPSIISDDQAIQWAKSGAQFSMILPGIDEDGRAHFWKNCANTTKLDPHSVIMLEGVGLRVDWGWPAVIKFVTTLKQ